MAVCETRKPIGAHFKGQCRLVSSPSPLTPPCGPSRSIRSLELDGDLGRTDPSAGRVELRLLRRSDHEQPEIADDREDPDGDGLIDAQATSDQETGGNADHHRAGQDVGDLLPYFHLGLPRTSRAGSRGAYRPARAGDWRCEGGD